MLIFNVNSPFTEPVPNLSVLPVPGYTFETRVALEKIWSVAKSLLANALAADAVGRKLSVV